MKLTETTSNYIESPTPEDRAGCEANQEGGIQGFSRMERDMPNVWTHDATSKYKRVEEAS
jgi:hypothetical protein